MRTKSLFGISQGSSYCMGGMFPAQERGRDPRASRGASDSRARRSIWSSVGASYLLRQLPVPLLRESCDGCANARV